MDPNQPQQPNPLAGLMALMGPNTAAQPPVTQQAAPPTQPAAVPQGGAASTQAAPAPQSSMAPMIQGMMGQAQTAMNAPMGQPVAPSNPIIDALKHPIVAGLLKALASAAQSYGWTAMMPQEREERTQMQQQKGEALSRLAETGAYQEGMLGIRGQQADTQAQRAGTYAQDVASKGGLRDVQEQNMQDRMTLAQDMNQWKQAIASGRLDVAQQMIDQRATQFEQKLALQQKQLGLEGAKVELIGEGMGIKEGMLNLAKTALSQKGTVQGAQVASKIQQFAIEHPILSQFMDLSDIGQLTQGAGAAGIPGVQPPPSVVPQPSTTPNVAAPTPQTKGQAKKQQASGGGTHYYFDAQGNQIAGQ